MEQHIDKQLKQIEFISNYMANKITTLRMEYSVNGLPQVEMLMSEITNIKNFANNIMNNLNKNNQSILDKLAVEEHKKAIENMPMPVDPELKPVKEIKPVEPIDSISNAEVVSKTDDDFDDGFDDDEEL